MFVGLTSKGGIYPSNGVKSTKYLVCWQTRITSHHSSIYDINNKVNDIFRYIHLSLLFDKTPMLKGKYRFLGYMCSIVLLRLLQTF